MEEQNKAPEKIQLSNEEIANLPDAQFKTLVIRMLQELTEYFNSIKKTQAAMKVALCEIKKSLQGTNSDGKETGIQINSKVDEAKNQISYLEHKEKKNFNQNNKKQKESKKQE